MHDALADRSRVVYDPYTPEQQQGIRRQLEKFVAAQVPKTNKRAWTVSLNYRAVEGYRTPYIAGLYQVPQKNILGS